MRSRVRFMHAADLHLGASMRGLRGLSPEWGAKIIASIAKAYEHLVDVAIEEKLDFVIFAGDIFDTSHASYADTRLFVQGLERLHAAQIPVYMCTGNHDPYVSWDFDFCTLPPSAYMFDTHNPSFTVFEKDGRPLVALAGRGYYNQTFPKDESILRGISRQIMEESLGVSCPFSVGVLHTGLIFDAEKAPIDEKSLYATGMDYWALGHIHKPYVDNEANPCICFSGVIQGRDIKEEGPRGVNIITLEEGLPNTREFVPCASIVWAQVNVDISPCQNFEDIRREVMKQLFVVNGKAQCRDMCVRISLTGKTKLSASLKKTGTLEALRQSLNDSYPNFFCDCLVDKTASDHSLELHEASNRFLATLRKQRNRNKEEELEVVRQKLEKLGLELPNKLSNDYGRLADEALSLSQDMLFEA